MYSRPWAWFWTAVIGIGSGVSAAGGALAAGVQVGWSIALGVGSLLLFGGFCAVHLLDPRSRGAGASGGQDATSAER